jgi:hypothetical protein
MLIQLKETSNGPSGDDKPDRVSYRWPVAILIVGLAMTLAWGGFIVWLVLRLLHVV